MRLDDPPVLLRSSSVSEHSSRRLEAVRENLPTVEGRETDRERRCLRFTCDACVFIWALDGLAQGLVSVRALGNFTLLALVAALLGNPSSST